MSMGKLPKYANFKFVKTLNCKMGTIPAGSELTLDGNRITFNGFMIEPWYYDFFEALIMRELDEPIYLKRIGAPICMGKDRNTGV